MSAHTPRRPPPDAESPSSSAQPPPQPPPHHHSRQHRGSFPLPNNDGVGADDGDLTWLDFIHSGDPSNANRSDARKRRHVGAEPARRDYPYPNHNTVSPSRRQRSEMPPPPGPPPPFHFPRRTSGDNGSVRSGHGSARRDSDTSVPRWQPDQEATRCFVCKSEFTFWFRKHHCRKCGRVVCSGCSPHRITIPRQYIVQPDSASAETGHGANDPDSPTTSNPALGGGDVVRVCNPCVPDPWMPPDNADPIQAMMEDALRRNAQRRGRPMPQAQLQPPSDPNPSSTLQRSERYRYMPAPPPAAGDGTRQRPNFNQPVPSFSRSVPHQQTVGQIYSVLYNRAPHPPSSSSRPPGYGHRHTQSTTTHFGGPTLAAGPPVSAPRRPVGVPPREPIRPPPRQVREEDECPVCGTEMPPDESVREAHIQECIAARFITSSPSSSAAVPAATNPLSTQQPSSIPNTATFDHLSSFPTASSPANSTRPRATSYRPRGMVTYLATEKDCTAAHADDDAPECIICFEEFVPGDELGRMECLCKFHRRCIRMWWETKGQGVCPTHVLTEE